jgi:hypothetical protein
LQRLRKGTLEGLALEKERARLAPTKCLSVSIENQAFFFIDEIIASPLTYLSMLFHPISLFT